MAPRVLLWCSLKEKNKTRLYRRLREIKRQLSLPSMHASLIRSWHNDLARRASLSMNLSSICFATCNTTRILPRLVFQDVQINCLLRVSRRIRMYSLSFNEITGSRMKYDRWSWVSSVHVVGFHVVRHGIF